VTHHYRQFRALHRCEYNRNLTVFCYLERLVVFVHFDLILLVFEDTISHTNSFGTKKDGLHSWNGEKFKLRQVVARPLRLGLGGGGASLAPSSGWIWLLLIQGRYNQAEIHPLQPITLKFHPFHLDFLASHCIWCCSIICQRLKTPFGHAVTEHVQTKQSPLFCLNSTRPSFRNAPDANTQTWFLPTN